MPHKLNTLLKVRFPYIMIVVVIISILIMTSMKYLTLHSSYFDLGVFSNNLFLIYSASDFGLLFAGHAQPYLWFYSYIFSLAPKGYGSLAIILIQALILMSPLFWLVRRYSLIYTLAYLSFFPLWFNLLNDFHIDHLVVPLLFYFFITIEDRHYNKAFIVAILLALVKEVFALQTIACGIYLILSTLKLKHSKKVRSDKRNKNILLGVILIVFGFIYFYVINNVVFPIVLDSSVSRLNSSAYAWLGSGIMDMIYNIVSSPVYIMKEMFSSNEKIVYVLALFGSLGFVPLFSYRPLLVAAPILFVSLLSQNPNYYGLGHHYTAGLIAPFIFSFIYGLEKVASFFCKTERRGSVFFVVFILGLLMSNIVLSPSPIGRLFWSEKIWNYNYNAYLLTDRTAMIKQAIDETIPSDESISVSVQNTLNFETLALRDCFLVFPQGLGVLSYQNDYNRCNNEKNGGDGLIMADYVVLDIKRPWFLLDKGCDWLYGKCTDNKLAKEYLEWVEKTRKIMQVVFERDGFIILQRNNNSG